MSIVSTRKLTSRQRLWLAAIKVPVYSVSVIPIIVGSSAAFEKISTFDFRIFTTFLISSILIIAWINISNDYFDAETGIDKNKENFEALKRLYPRNLPAVMTAPERLTPGITAND